MSESECDDEPSDDDANAQDEDDVNEFEDAGRFTANECLTELWSFHEGNLEKLTLEEATPRNVKPIELHNTIEGSKTTYFSALNEFWDYLLERGLYNEMLPLPQYPVVLGSSMDFIKKFLRPALKSYNDHCEGNMERFIERVMQTSDPKLYKGRGETASLYKSSGETFYQLVKYKARRILNHTIRLDISPTFESTSPSPSQHTSTQYIKYNTFLDIQFGMQHKSPP